MSNNNLTNKGKSWEILNSLWIVTSFLGIAWVGFFYIGSKAKQKKWTLFGIIYIVLLIVLPFISVESFIGETVSDILIGFYMLFYILSIIHSFKVRKEYLLRREALIDTQIDRKDDEDLKNRIRNQYITEAIEVAPQKTSVFSQNEIPIKNTENVPTSKTEIKNSPTNYSNESEKIKTVDINTCIESDLSSLPGITVVTAKKAINHRNENGNFSNVDEFFQLLEIKPHFVVQLRKVLTCSSTEQENRNQRMGRVLDF